MASPRVLPPDGPSAPVLVHVPHAGTTIPTDVRADLLRDDEGLAEELRLLTDHRTDVLAADTGDHGATRVVNDLSRLVVDPERLPDDREELAAHGMGAVYTVGADRTPLRGPDPERDRQLLATYFHPYARAMVSTVDGLLDRHGHVTIVDLHSYPSTRLPYELHDGPRPPLCIGTDPFHTPRWLVDTVTDLADDHGIRWARDTPFAGTYIPLDRYERDRRVRGVMLEFRRDGYLDELTATPHAGERGLRSLVAAIVAAVAGRPQR